MNGSLSQKLSRLLRYYPGIIPAVLIKTKFLMQPDHIFLSSVDH